MVCAPFITKNLNVSFVLILVHCIVNSQRNELSHLVPLSTDDGGACSVLEFGNIVHYLILECQSKCYNIWPKTTN